MYPAVEAGSASAKQLEAVRAQVAGREEGLRVCAEAHAAVKKGSASAKQLKVVAARLAGSKEGLRRWPRRARTWAKKPQQMHAYLASSSNGARRKSRCEGSATTKKNMIRSGSLVHLDTLREPSEDDIECEELPEPEAQQPAGRAARQPLAPAAAGSAAVGNAAAESQPKVGSPLSPAAQRSSLAEERIARARASRDASRDGGRAGGSLEATPPRSTAERGDHGSSSQPDG